MLLLIIVYGLMVQTISYLFSFSMPICVTERQTDKPVNLKCTVHLRGCDGVTIWCQSPRTAVVSWLLLFHPVISHLFQQGNVRFPYPQRETFMKMCHFTTRLIFSCTKIKTHKYIFGYRQMQCLHTSDNVLSFRVEKS